MQAECLQISEFNKQRISYNIGTPFKYDVQFNNGCDKNLDKLPFNIITTNDIEKYVKSDLHDGCRYNSDIQWTEKMKTFQALALEICSEEIETTSKVLGISVGKFHRKL